MKRLIFALLVAAALSPVAALAASPSTRAQQDCVQLRATMGLSAFKQAYPTFGACVSAYTKIENQVQVSAKSTCTAERSDPSFTANHDGKTFNQYYGTGKSGKNAFGNCVSMVARANAKAEQSGRLNPARTCRALRSQLGTAIFNQTYGTNANGKNAFGKCVSATAKSQAQNQISASTSCKAQQSDPNFAANNGGMTFAQYYGTNADDSNAFGKCVSSTAKASSQAHGQAVVNAARTCKAERKADPSAFKTKYKTFGQCVRQNAKP